MALADVKAYFKQVEAQWFEAKDDLAEFEKALKAGHITEDRLDAVKEDFACLDENYKRLAYIMHLYALPDRRSRKMSKSDKKVVEVLVEAHSDAEYVLRENEDALVNLRAHIKELEQKQ